MANGEKWFSRLKTCLRAMPETVEIAVTDGVITLLPAGAVSRAFESDGHLDNYAEEWLDSVQHKRVITCGESL